MPNFDTGMIWGYIPRNRNLSKLNPNRGSNCARASDHPNYRAVFNWISAPTIEFWIVAAITHHHSLILHYRGIDVSRNYTPDTMSPEQMQMPIQQGPSRMASATPTMQQRIKALGVATPLTLSSPVRRYVHWISDLPQFLPQQKKRIF